jgi:hypothetical protein
VVAPSGLWGRHGGTAPTENRHFEDYIAVEIKSFLGSSSISDFHLAVGQYINYKTILNQKDPQRLLYLAIPEETFNNFFKLEFTQIVTKSYEICFIVYSIEKEVIVQWQN